MKLYDVQDLGSGKVIARDIIKDEEIIIKRGTGVKEEYIPLLLGMKINKVYIEDPGSEADLYLDEKTDLEYIGQIKEFYERYLHYNNVFGEIQKLADRIFNSIEKNKEHLKSCKLRLDDENPDLYLHIYSVTILSSIIALKLEMDEKTRYEIVLGCLLHDIGYRYISIDKYIDVKMDTLTPNEVFEFRKHTIYGFSAIESEAFATETVKNIVLSHHEKLNGSGYPLKQRILGPETKVVAVCDCIDSRVRGIGCQVQRKDEILLELEQNNKEYDKKVVMALLDIVKQ